MYIISAKNVDEALSQILTVIDDKDVILVKASRVMGLERVTEFLENNF